MPPTFFDPIRRFYKPQQLATAPISICHSPWRQNRSHCRYGLPPPAPTAKTMPWSRARRIPKFRRQPRRFFLPQPQVLMPRKQPLSETVLSMIPGPDPGPRFRCQESMYTAPRPRHRFRRRLPGPWCRPIRRAKTLATLLRQTPGAWPCGQQKILASAVQEACPNINRDLNCVQY